MHVVEIIDALFIIAELDGKNVRAVNVAQRKKLKPADATEYF